MYSRTSFEDTLCIKTIFWLRPPDYYDHMLLDHFSGFTILFHLRYETTLQLRPVFSGPKGDHNIKVFTALTVLKTLKNEIGF